MIRRRRIRARRTPRFPGLSFNRLVPNILTLLALCAGLTAIRFGWQGRWEMAVYAVLLAGILDGLDGRIARLLKGTSRFGAELDSLSDFLCFGVGPAILMFAWTLQDAGGFGWVFCLMFSVSCALRLARFNTSLDDTHAPGWSYNFFSGTPAPAGAGLALLPMMLSFGTGLEEVFRTPWLVAAVLLVVSFLMVSRVPTYSLKNFKVPASYVLPMLLGIAAVAAFLVAAPWVTLTAVGLLYVGSIPFSIRSYRRLQRQAEAHAEADANGGDGGATDGNGGATDGESGATISFPDRRGAG